MLKESNNSTEVLQLQVPFIQKRFMLPSVTASVLIQS